MLKKTILGHKIDIVWTIKMAKSDGSMKMVKVAHTGEISDKDLDDIDALIEKYADTGVLDEMKERPESFLWCRARAIDANVPNENGDFFGEEELLKEVDAGKKGKIPAYKTFEGVPIYTNHKNDDIEQAKGKVVHAEWDKNEKCVYCTFYIDSEAYPQLARGIQENYIKDVSMGASVDHSRCSICDNKAQTEKDFCSCIKQYKGRKFSGVVPSGPNKGKRFTDEPVFEKNYGVKFIELSCVSDGAYENCEIEQTLPRDKMIKSMANLIKKEAHKIDENIKLGMQRSEILDSNETRELFVSVANLKDKIVKFANSEETRLLKFSQIFPESPRNMVSPADQINPLVAPESTESIEPMAEQPQMTPPLQDGTSPAGGEGVGINTLDALKSVIQNINTVIVTLLNTRGINLEHVRDLSKSVADIQDTIEDMIDSGSIDISGSVPITPGQTPQAGLQAPPAPEGMPPQPAGNPEYATPPEGVGMQIGAEAKQKITKLAKLKEKLEKTCKRICDTHPNKEEGGIMSEFRKLAATLREQKSAEKVETYEQEMGGYKISVASNGDIKASYRGVQVDWKPDISDDLINRIDEGQIANVTSDLLNQFVLAYSDNRRIQRVASVDAETPAEGTERRFQAKDATWPVGRLGTPGYPEENYIENARKGLNSNRENDLGEVRKGIDPRVKEHQLADRDVAGGILGRDEVDPRVKEHQLEDVREGVDVQVEENRLSPRRANGDASKIVEAVNRALAKSVVESMVSPEEIVEASIKLASNENVLAELISEYSSKEHKDARDVLRKRSRFYGKKVVVSESNASADSYIVGNLADVASEEVLPMDLVHGLRELKNQNQDKYASLIGQMAKDEIDQSGNSSQYIESYEPDLLKRSEIRKQFLKAMASQDSGDQQVSKESVKSVITALAKTLIEKKASDEEMLNLLGSFDRNDMYSEIELAKDKDLVAQRKIATSRRKYWMSKKSNIEAVQEDISQKLINMIADNISDNKVSTRSAVDTMEMLKDKPEATKKAINMAVDKLMKTSASVTDRSEREFTVQFDLSECGCDKDDPEVESRIREYVVRLFGDRGYELSDPASLSFTSLEINDNGHVCGTIKSSVVRTFSANEARESAPVAIGVVANSILSDKVIQARKNEREALVKAAQAMGGMGAVGGEGLAGNPGADPAAAATGADPGIAAITGGGEPGASDEMGDEKSPEESLPTPGQIAPPGSLCPACGSTDVDLSEGHGKCNDCATEFEVRMQIQIINPEGFSEGNNLPEEEPLEMGEEVPAEQPNPLEGATGAAAGTPAVGGAGAPMGAPGTPMARSIYNRVVTASSEVPLIVRLSWDVEPDVFLRTAYAHKGEIKKAGAQSAGHVCPACGETESVVRVPTKDKTNVYCDACSTMSVVKLARTEDGKIRNSITWCI